MERDFEGLSAGDSVISADGEKLGTVAAIREDSLLVEKGLFFVTDYEIPVTAIARFDDDAGELHLNVTRDEALGSGWEVEPFLTTLVEDPTLIRCGEVARPVFDVVNGAPIPHDPIRIGELALPAAGFSDLSLAAIESARSSPRGRVAAYAIAWRSGR